MDQDTAFQGLVGPGGQNGPGRPGGGEQNGTHPDEGAAGRAKHAVHQRCGGKGAPGIGMAHAKSWGAEVHVVAGWGGTGVEGGGVEPKPYTLRCLPAGWGPKGQGTMLDS